MAEVFISYSSTDSEKANEILARLEGAGISCWLSQRDIPPGADYALEIPKAITACSHFVLLLTNAAQNSPYVMLELDQAFKQKKEILPILLEQVQENEKTNFFLNAKQKEDATKNLTAAVNKVIHRIRPGISKFENEPNQQEKSLLKHPKIIHCPHCGGVIHKEIKDPWIGRGIEVKEGEVSYRKYIEWGHTISDGQKLALFCLILLTPLVILYTSLCIYAAISENKEFIFPGIVSAVLIILWATLLALFISQRKKQYEYEIEEYSDAYIKLRKTLVQTINNSELKYWTLKCAKCEAEFSILLPKEETLDYRVATLLRDEKFDNSFLQ